MYPNRFESQGFAKFWLRVEQEWAEAEKKLLYYPDQMCPYCGDPACLGECDESLEDEEEEF